jgi:magnesium chelatase accessory protein
MDWAQAKLDWPHADHSEFIQTKHMKWHVQRWVSKNKKATTFLLLHGTGASSHSWRDLAPLLAADYNVMLVDLPGHAFSGRPAMRWMSIEGMSVALAELLSACNTQPTYVVGHSAGAAIAVKMVLLKLITPKKIFSFNGALLPLDNLVGKVFSPIAKLLALNPLVPRLFSWQAKKPVVLENLLGSTGSVLDETGNALYSQLIQSHAHAAGALAMMANWDLYALKRELHLLKTPLVLVTASNDKTIQPSDAARLKTLITHAELVTMNNLGHLSHEEAPQQAYSIIATRL